MSKASNRSVAHDTVVQKRRSAHPSNSCKESISTPFWKKDKFLPTQVLTIQWMLRQKDEQVAVLLVTPLLHHYYWSALHLWQMNDESPEGRVSFAFWWCKSIYWLSMQLFFCHATDNGIPEELNTLIIVMDYNLLLMYLLQTILHFLTWWFMYICYQIIATTFALARKYIFLASWTKRFKPLVSSSNLILIYEAASCVYKCIFQTHLC